MYVLLWFKNKSVNAPCAARALLWRAPRSFVVLLKIGIQTVKAPSWKTLVSPNQQAFVVKCGLRTGTLSFEQPMVFWWNISFLWNRGSTRVPELSTSMVFHWFYSKHINRRPLTFNDVLFSNGYTHIFRKLLAEVGTICSECCTNSIPSWWSCFQTKFCW